MVTQLSTPHSPAPNATLSLSDFVCRYYLPFIQENKHSWKSDEGNLKRCVLPHLGKCMLDDISTETLENRNVLLESQQLSYGSRFRIFWMLKYVLHCAVRWGYLKDIRKFTAANLPARPSRSSQLLSTKKAMALKKWPAAGALRLLLTTGTNLTEILNARWEDVDFEKGTLATSASFTGRVRLIPLNNEALKFVQKLPRYADVSRLFQRVLETGWPRWREWEIIRPKLGMPKLCIQNLCHTFAKSLMGTGVGQNEVRSIMGYYRVEHLKNLNAPNGVS